LNTITNTKTVKQPKNLAHFTLIELLTVIAIMMIVMAIALPSLTTMMAGGGVTAASREISSQLSMARQYAIANRKYIALVMPKEPIAGEPTLKPYKSFRHAIVDKNYKFISWVPDTKWEDLPKGAVIAQVDDKNGYNPPPAGDSTSSGFFITHPSGNVRAVVFRPSGTVPGSHKKITVLEGAYDAGSLVIDSSEDAITISVNPFTGNIKYE